MSYRYFVELQFKGTNFHGWQIQPNAITIQQTLNNAFSVVLREKMSLTGCGRTDTGVHANYFVAHFDSEKPELHEDQKILYGLNGYLSSDISVLKIHRVAKDSHARFHATKRIYHYYIRHHKNPFRTDYSTFMSKNPDYDLMNEASKILLGNHDFSCFCKGDSDIQSNLCEVFEAFWKPIGTEHVFIISANRFLRNMVRAIVGTMLETGLGKIAKDELRTIMDSKNRSLAGVSVPAKGLYLWDVNYPDEILGKEKSHPFCKTFV